MAFTIPVDGEWARYSVGVPLDGEDFTLSFEWNTRAARWFLSVLDAASNELATSVPLVVDVPLLQKYASLDLPAGWLMALDTSELGEEMAEMEDLGTRVQLVYLDAAEVDAL